MRAESCYWCAAPATGREHTPPKCIFPEFGEVADGKNYRDQLLTVPSCDVHNIAKSHDDEYLLCILALSIHNNKSGENHAVTKVLRALRRAPRLTERVLGKSLAVLVENMIAGKIDETIAVKVDNARIDSVLEHVARGLHFHHFRERWTGYVSTISEFLVGIGSPSVLEINQSLERLRICATDFFADSEKYGANQEIFFYQVRDDPADATRRFMRLSFYEGTRSLVIFSTDSRSQRFCAIS